MDNDGGTAIAAMTTNISEEGTSGLYVWNAPAAPATVGQYTIMWSTDGTFSADSTTVDDLVVVTAGAGDTLPPISPLDPEPGAAAGPCNMWTTEDDVAACCNATVGTDTSVLEDAVAAASRTLWTLSGRQFSGTCDATVRPCSTTSNCFQVLSRGHIVAWDGWRWTDSVGLSMCGCSPLSEVLLWYPVREVVEVKVDGDVVDSGDYFLYDRRKLVRKDGGRWPSCQNMTLDDTEDGTFSVRFTYGVNPPQSGQDAAKELACEVFKACSDSEEECRLPTGVTRVTRQGITIERNFFRRDPVTGAWNTGLALVDQFLNEVNPSGLRRRPAIYSPDVKYPRPAPV